MPFRVALSGLNAASSELNVIANNIANANTAGFKNSRAEFADVFATGGAGSGSAAIGSGVRLASVTQQFNQGNIEFTESSLDLAINGQGFFTLRDGSGYVYTRAGGFGVDRDGFVVNSQNQRLQVFESVEGGGFNTGSLIDLRLQTTQSTPSATTSGSVVVNLPADAEPPSVAVFDPADPLSYSHSTSSAVYDSLGNLHQATFYFMKTATANQWEVAMAVDGNLVDAPQTLEFTAAGAQTVPAGGDITFPAYDPANGADPLNMTFDFSGATQFGGPFSVSALVQDGFSSGRLTSIDISDSGVVFARFTNGRAIELGKVALANFPNAQGLRQLGKTSWGESFASGGVIMGEAGSASYGLIQSGALEDSNVDLTKELVQMITSQRSFQANAQMISTADSITQTIINIR
jgi:flagellar hook protein FlgE